MADGFRVGIHDGSGEFRLKLEGRLGAEESREVEWCWRTGASTIGARRFVVDVSRALLVDSAAADLLRRMRESGAEFVETPVREPFRPGRLVGLLGRLFARAGRPARPAEAVSGESEQREETLADY
jgi:hypothetical protein